MQKKILRTTALILCFCILLLAVPNTFARSEKRNTKFESRFFFVNPGELLTNVLVFLAPHFNLHAYRTGTPPDKNTKNFKKKLTGDLNKVKISDD